MRWLLTIFAALALAGCSAAEDTKAAELGVTNFHRDMDGGKYAQIYDASGQQMKSAITRDDFVKLLDGIHSKLGPFKAGKTTGWNVNVGTAGHVVSLTRDAQFERGAGTENFVFTVEQDRAVLEGYHVNSNALITN